MDFEKYTFFNWEKMENCFCVLLVLTLTLTLIRGENSNNQSVEQDENDLSSLQKGRTRRTLWLDKRRRLILPPDTSLSITPVLAFPVFKESSTWVAFENLQIQWTFLSIFLIAWINFSFHNEKNFLQFCSRDLAGHQKKMHGL